MDTPRTRNVAIVLYENVEILDFTGPFQVFAAAGRDGNGFAVFTVADHTDLITSAGGMRIKPDYAFGDHPPIDIVVVPGGGFRAEEPASRRLVDWVRHLDASAEIISSVCTGSGVLGRAGVLDGRKATTHWASIERLRELFPAVDVVAGARFVDTGHVVTAAGVSAGIDMSLHLVERLGGRDLAERTARYMEYDSRAWEAAVA
jgi:transcriptional regulator GlxA family with amidase domain